MGMGKSVERSWRSDYDNSEPVHLDFMLMVRFERLHPRPDWANRRIPIGTPSLSSLLSTTKSFIEAPPRDARGSLPQGTIEIQRVRNATQQNPTTGKRQAADAGGGVVDLAWHPNPKVGVLAVSGGDRRVRFFNVSSFQGTLECSEL